MIKKLVLAAAFLAGVSHTVWADPGRPRYPDYTGPVKYPAGASAAAIAVNEAVRMSIRGTEGLVFCQTIDTSDPRARCITPLVLDGGGVSGATSGVAGATY